jgi:chromosome segregation ATPase
MKSKLAIAVLLVVAVILGIGWRIQWQQDSVRETNLLTRMHSLSNDLSRTSSQAATIRQAKAGLEQRVSALTAQLQQTSNQLSVAQSSLAEVRSAAQKAARAAEEELNKRAERIAELEVANKNLDRRAKAAKAAIADLEGRITDLQRQLASARGDRDFLMNELKRLQTEKAEVERRFNDLVVLREQVRKLQSELAATSQLEAIRTSLSRRRHLKGAEVLRRGFRPRPRPPVDLDVELRRNGPPTIKAHAPTNNPAAPKQ